MIWFLAGIVPPFLWSIVNHIDKYLLSRSKYKSSVEVLMIYSTGFSIVILPVVYWFAKDELFTNLSQIAVQIVGGVLFTFSLYFFLKALFKDEASIVIPFVLLVPVFGYVLSYIFLGETLSGKQLIACALILLGALILSFEIKEDARFRLNKGVAMLMLLSTLLQAIQETMFKYSAIEASFAVSLFWLHIGIIIFCAGLLLFKRGTFTQFSTALRTNGKPMFVVNFFAELTASTGYIVRDYALLLAPIVVIMALNGFQPAFVFILGIILTVFFPKFVQEKIQPVHLLHKGSAIAIMIAGTILIAQTL